ncbi:class I SAM-dependent methyltransferase [Cellulomonas aerilata]|uniref:SAM-dependent methyltransferase n=1 Tax=Cellulomonas aerilata TaxID=515326 RepID=A0A512DGR9_9CELL|nr:class I SAM-dependent methyltransferase [Cellulomonas aerilata]GEO35616.1 SAM-dependent methyltransferase [Cellulomonas aerilata]
MTASDDPDPRRATVFGRHAEDYDRWRPGYPDAAVDWMLPAGAREVADVGAGTGKLTGALLARGLHVDAVEPDPDMLAVLRRRHPAAHAHLAGAQALPLADAGVDAVLVASAWHWFPAGQAVAEVRRVLPPGGRLAVAWNGPTPTVGGWTSELAALDPDRGRKDWTGRLRATGLPPDELEEARVPWTWDVSADDVRGTLATHSALTLMDADDRERLLDAAHGIVAAACAAAGTATVPWPQTCVCVRWTPDRRTT